MNYKPIMDAVVILSLLATLYWITQPQGQELIECRTYQPLIANAKKCATENPNGNWTLYCISLQEAAIRSTTKNFTEWFNESS